MDSDKEVIEIAFDRRQLELLKSAVVDTQELHSVEGHDARVARTIAASGRLAPH